MKPSCKSVLMGTAIGDSLGLPAENLSRERIQKRWAGVWEQRLFMGRGMVSDDTEHAVFVAQCLLAEGADAARFGRLLAWKLRWWIVCVPPGIGLATLKACLRLWLGFTSTESGVWSAGNGPAMRSALIGAYLSDDEAVLREFVKVSTRLTHTDPRAETGALAVALTAAWCVGNSVENLEGKLGLISHIWRSAGPDDKEWHGWVDKMVGGLDRGLSVEQFAVENGMEQRVTGYIYQTVPVALFAWFRHFGDFKTGLQEAMNCGGDVDTVGAIAGALLALNSELPQEWVEGVGDYPISRTYLEALGDDLERVDGRVEGVWGFKWLIMPARNLFLLALIFWQLGVRCFR